MESALKMQHPVALSLVILANKNLNLYRQLYAWYLLNYLFSLLLYNILVVRKYLFNFPIAFCPLPPRAFSREAFVRFRWHCV